MPTSSDLDTDTQEHGLTTFPEQFSPVVFPPDWHECIARRARQIVKACRANGQKRKQARTLVEGMALWNA